MKNRTCVHNNEVSSSTVFLWHSQTQSASAAGPLGAGSHRVGCEDRNTTLIVLLKIEEGGNNTVEV